MEHPTFGVMIKPAPFNRPTNVRAAPSPISSSSASLPRPIDFSATIVRASNAWITENEGEGPGAFSVMSLSRNCLSVVGMYFPVIVERKLIKLFIMEECGS
jgi:hypothetical protein